VSGRPPVSAQAPGKMFIAGEYAVLEPGHPAILVAVDRQVSVSVSGADGDGVVIDSDLFPGETRLRRGRGGLVGPGADGGFGHVVSAIEVVEELLTARGLGTTPIRVSVESDLHRDGIKFGLGSSGAVTVAVVSAVAAYCGMRLSLEERFRLSMLAMVRRDTGSSGGDLAASVWGGWIAYRAPDRVAVRDLARVRGIEEMLRVPWPELRVRRLRAPRRLSLEVGWTGQPADTATLAGGLRSPERSFVTRSDACVLALIRALERADDHAVLEQIRDARHLLAELDAETRLGIFTPRLTALCDAAEAVGGAAKPSGAGGGDCGIAFLDATGEREISQLHQKWVSAGVLPMHLQVQPTNGSTE
jgi:phosphomevalonate kinase